MQEVDLMGAGSTQVKAIKSKTKSLDPQKINQIRLEHFENYKKLRRRMDRSYIKMRNIQNHGSSGGGGDTEVGFYSQRSADGRISNPALTESMKTYKQISQNLKNLHA